MKILYFSPNNMSKRYPPAIILPTSESINKLLHELSGHCLDPVEQVLTNVMDEIINAIRYERNAVLNLEYDCMGIVMDTMDSPEEKAAAQFAMTMVEFGKTLFATLKEIGAYHRGYLPYQYHGRVRRDIVLYHLDYEGQ